MRLALREAERALEHDDVPVGAVLVHARRGHRRRPQRARAARGPHGARRDDRHPRGRAGARLLAAARHGALRDARAVRDVRGRDRARPHPARASTARSTRRRAPPARCSTSSPSPGSTTARTSPAACWRRNAPSSCGRSSAPAAEPNRYPARVASGGVREWLNRAVSKTVVPVTPVPWVRIPPPPPNGKIRVAKRVGPQLRRAGAFEPFDMRCLLIATALLLALAAPAAAAPTHYVTMSDGASIALNVKVPGHCTAATPCPAYFEMSGYESGSDEGQTPIGHVAGPTGPPVARPDRHARGARRVLRRPLRDRAREPARHGLLVGRVRRVQLAVGARRP